MNGLVFRRPLVCLVQLGLVACGAAGETPAMGESGTSTMGTANGDIEGPPLSGNPVATAAQNDHGEDNGIDDDAGEARDGNGGEPTPGVDVTVGEHGVTVHVALPDGRAIRVVTKTGSGSTTGTGVDIEGDVTIDLGTGLPMPLASSNLHIEVGRGMPTLSGTANVSGSLLDGIGCGCVDDWLPVEVSLDADATAELTGSASELALALNLAMNDVALDIGTLPLGVGAMVLGDADVTITSDGEHRWVSVAGQVTGDPEIWASTVPLDAASELMVKATIADGVLLAVQLQGSVALKGGELWCGITPLRALAMPEALVRLDRSGLWLHAMAEASAHPGFSVAANALVDGRFTSQGWSLMVCADVMTDILSASVKLGQCMSMTAGGTELCDCHRNDDGHCDGGGV